MKSTVELQMYQNLHEQTWASSAESRTWGRRRAGWPIRTSFTLQQTMFSVWD
jgi:hypothetical protein